MNIKSGVLFILDGAEFQVETSFDLLPRHTLRRASDIEIAQFDRHIQSFSPLSANLAQIPYQFRAVSVEENGQINTSFSHLPKNEWRYWVIAFDGLNDKLHNIELAFALIEPEIELGFTVFFSEEGQRGDISGISTMTYHLIAKFSAPRAWGQDVKKVTKGQLILARNIVNELEANRSESIFARKALEDFYLLYTVPAGSNLRIVGLFAIIESLTTHAPRLTETLDSINHQITNKLILLRKLFEDRIEVAYHFPSLSEEKTWKLLYSYRSAIAHGGAPDFNGTHKGLQSPLVVLNFLNVVTKQLILYSMRNPTFMMDLKKC